MNARSIGKSTSPPQKDETAIVAISEISWVFRRLSSMLATNAAATVVRNSEADTKSSTLDLALDSIVLLKRQGKSSVKNIVSPSSFQGWLESSPSEGEQW